MINVAFLNDRCGMTVKAIPYAVPLEQLILESGERIRMLSFLVKIDRLRHHFWRQNELFFRALVLGLIRMNFNLYCKN